MKRLPLTREEWQVCVDAAHGALHLHSAQAYGLVTGGPRVDVAACEEALERGRRLGVTPSPDAVERFIAEMLAEAGR